MVTVKTHLILLTITVGMPFFSILVAFEFVIGKPIGSPTVIANVKVPQLLIPRLAALNLSPIANNDESCARYLFPGRASIPKSPS